MRGQSEIGNGQRKKVVIDGLGTSTPVVTEKYSKVKGGNEYCSSKTNLCGNIVDVH